MRTIGRAPDTSAWTEKEWDIELGLEIRDWEGRRQRKTHIRSLWEYVLNGRNPNVLHFITELMAFKGGWAGTEPLAVHEELGFYTTLFMILWTVFDTPPSMQCKLCANFPLGGLNVLLTYIAVM